MLPRTTSEPLSSVEIDRPASVAIPVGPPRQQRLGRSAYTGFVPSAYDLLVLGLSNRMVWRCPTARILEHYQDHVTANHLEVAVGTGYLLERIQFPIATPRLALLDLNVSSANGARRRLARYSPEAYEGDVLQPISGIRGRFDSVGLNYLLHCLPGPFEAKATAFDNLLPLVAEGGIVFGATIIGSGMRRPVAARGLAGLYNRLGIFDNDDDTPEALRAALSSRFEDWHVETVGAAALFWARRGPVAPWIRRPRFPAVAASRARIA